MGTSLGANWSIAIFNDSNFCLDSGNLRYNNTCGCFSMSEPNRKIHVSLAEELHKRVRIRCACEDVSIQDYVVSVIEKDMSSYTPTDALAVKAMQGESKQKRRSSGK